VGKNDEFFFWSKAGDVCTLLQCFIHFFFRRLEGVILLGIQSAGRDMGYRKYATNKIFNHLKPTGYVMHHQFNIKKLYALPTLYLCVLYLSENKQRLVPLTA
jgi:hypothetical protein